MMTPLFAGSALKRRSWWSPTASNSTPTTHSSTPEMSTGSNSGGVGPNTAETCSGSETNHVAAACTTNTLRSTCTAEKSPRNKSR